MNKHLICGVLCAAVVAAPAHALEFAKTQQRGMAGLFGQLMPVPLPSANARANAAVAQGRLIDEREVKARNEGKVELPRCVRPEGSLRIVEPDDGQSLWASYGLPMPTRMLRTFVTSSSCFTVLDRGVGFAAAQAERELAAGGHLQGSANIGGGQMLAADYILIPDIVSQNTNAGGRNFGASGGGSLGGLGRLMGGGGSQSRRKTASVMLTLMDSRTSEVLATATGEAEISDRQWQLMLSGSGSNGVASGQGGISAGAYENTEIGTVVRAAYHYAFHQLLVNLEPMDLRARANSAPQATQQQQPAQVTAYGTGGMPTASTSGQPAQMALDQHAAHLQLHAQQQPTMPPPQPMAYAQQPQPVLQGGQLSADQLQQMQLQMQQMQLQLQQQQAMAQQPGMVAQAAPAMQVMGSPVQAQGMQLAAAAADGLQQGNLAQAVVQGAAGVAQQMAGQVMPAGTAQLVGAAAQGLQQGNLGQAVVQGAVQQFAGTAASTNAVLVLKVPAELASDASGSGQVVRMLQPGETLARLGLSPNGSMIQVRDGQGVIGWIPAAIHADLITVHQ